VAVSTTTIPPSTYAAGQQLQVRLQATGSAPTTLRAKVWPVGSAEPGSWQVTTTDSTAGLQSPGGVGVTTYMAGSSTNLPVLATFDDLLVTYVPTGARFGFPAAGVENEPVKAGSRDMRGSVVEVV